MLNKLFYATIALLSLLLPISAIAADNGNLSYEIEGAGTGMQGTYLVKVTVISKKKKVDKKTEKEVKE